MSTIERMENTAPPRPTWFQSITATLVLLVNAAIVSLSLMIIAEELRVFLPAYVVAAAALLVMNVQYFAMFCFSRQCTTFMLWVLSIALVMLCAFLLASTQMLENAETILVLVTFLILALVALTLGIAFHANWSWQDAYSSHRAGHATEAASVLYLAGPDDRDTSVGDHDRSGQLQDGRELPGLSRRPVPQPRSLSHCGNGAASHLPS